MTKNGTPTSECLIQWSLMMILIVCWMHSNAIWKWTLRARAQLLQMPPISERSQCKQHQAKIPSQLQRGCGWWREATSVRPPCHQRPRTTQLEGESAIARRRSPTVATLEDTPNSPQPSLLQHGGPVGQPILRVKDSTESMRGQLIDEVPRRRRWALLPKISGMGVVPEDCTTNLRKARRGAAGGPSGMTAEHLKRR